MSSIDPIITTADNRRLDALLNIIYKCLNRSDDRLHNPSSLSKLLIYISLVLSVIMPILCFALFVYPTVTAYATNKAQTVSIPLLKRQVAQLKKEYQNSRAMLIDLETDTPSAVPRNIDTAQYYTIDLHQLAHTHRLTIIAMDTLNGHAISPRFAEYFTATRFSWHLKGSFFNYLAFKKALQAKHSLTHIEREYLSPRADGQLDIVVDLNVYQAKEIAS